MFFFVVVFRGPTVDLRKKKNIWCRALKKKHGFSECKVEKIQIKSHGQGRGGISFFSELGSKREIAIVYENIVSPIVGVSYMCVACGHT